VNGSNQAGAGSYKMDNNGNRLDPVKYRSTFSWASTYLGEPDEFFLIEMIDSAGLREGVFMDENFENPYSLRFSLSYRDAQGWFSPLFTKEAALHITKIDQNRVEGTFSGIFHNDVAVTDGEFSIYTGK
jgi:hypothetical protein